MLSGRLLPEGHFGGGASRARVPGGAGARVCVARVVVGAGGTPITIAAGSHGTGRLRVCSASPGGGARSLGCAPSTDRLQRNNWQGGCVDVGAGGEGRGGGGHRNARGNGGTSSCRPSSRLRMIHQNILIHTLSSAQRHRRVASAPQVAHNQNGCGLCYADVREGQTHEECVAEALF